MWNRFTGIKKRSYLSILLDSFSEKAISALFASVTGISERDAVERELEELFRASGNSRQNLPKSVGYGSSIIMAIVLLSETVFYQPRYRLEQREQQRDLGS